MRKTIITALISTFFLLSLISHQNRSFDSVKNGTKMVDAADTSIQPTSFVCCSIYQVLQYLVWFFFKISLYKSSFHEDVFLLLLLYKMMVGAFSHSTTVGKLRKTFLMFEWMLIYKMKLQLFVVTILGKGWFCLRHYVIKMEEEVILSQCRWFQIREECGVSLIIQL